MTFGGLVALDSVSLSASEGPIVGLLGPERRRQDHAASACCRGCCGRGRAGCSWTGVDVTGASPTAPGPRGPGPHVPAPGAVPRAHRARAPRGRVPAGGARRGANLLVDCSAPADGRPRRGRSRRRHPRAPRAHPPGDRRRPRPCRSGPVGWWRWRGRWPSIRRVAPARRAVLGPRRQRDDELVTVLRPLRDERGIALVLVEHNVELVLGLADEVTVLDFGSEIADGNPGRRSARTARSRPPTSGRPPHERERRAPATSPSTRPVADAPAPASTTVDAAPRGRDLEVTYGEARALFGVSLSLSAGQPLAVLGANGAGKSSLAAALAGSSIPSAGAGITLRRPRRHPLAVAPRQPGPASPTCPRAAGSSPTSR